MQTSADVFHPALPLASIDPSPTNPRKILDPAELKELAASIRVHGVLQPVIVRPHPEAPGRFMLVAGERRYRASLQAQRSTIPAMERNLSADAVLEIQIVENLQRADVHPLDEAQGYRVLMDRGYTAQAIGERIGKSEKYVYDRLKLTGLIPELQTLFVQRKFTAGHAILLARLPERRQAIAIAKGWLELSVRALGRIVQQKDTADREEKAIPAVEPGDYRRAAEAIVKAAKKGDTRAREALSHIMSEMGRIGAERRWMKVQTSADTIAKRKGRSQ